MHRVVGAPDGTRAAYHPLTWGEDSDQPGSLVRDARGIHTFPRDVVRMIDPERDRVHGVGMVEELITERKLVVRWTHRGPVECNAADIEHVYP